MPVSPPAYPSRSTQHTIAIPHVRMILQGARRRGLDIDAVLRRAAIPPSLLASPLSRVTQEQFAVLIFVLRRLLRDELWGLCRQPVRVGSFVQACELLIHCQTLGEALHAGSRFYRLLLSDFSPRVVVAADQVGFRILSKLPCDDLLSFAERVFSFFTYGLACWLVARRIPLIEVRYPLAEKGCVTNGEVLFQTQVVYVGDTVEFRFDRKWLALPIVQNRQSLGEFLQQAPASLLIRYRDQTNLTERIRRLLRKHLAQDLPSLDDMGRMLAMTPQTLRRRLAEEGKGYQAIKDDLRRDAAIEYLAQPELTLPDIANRLGYAEASSFHRAFKAWTGLAPGEYRQTRLRA